MIAYALLALMLRCVAYCRLRHAPAHYSAVTALTPIRYCCCRFFRLRLSHAIRCRLRCSIFAAAAMPLAVATLDVFFFFFFRRQLLLAA